MLPTEEEEMLAEEAPQEGDEDAALMQEIDAQQLKGLIEWASRGEGEDMKSRYGKLPPPAPPAPDEAPAEDADIPGVEAVPEGEGEAAAGPDVEKLKAVLAQMKMG